MYLVHLTLAYNNVTVTLLLGFKKQKKKNAVTKESNNNNYKINLTYLIP